MPAATNNTPDAELVRAARRGDKRAFVEIVARHQAMVCAVALGVLGDFAASEDAAQEAFLIAWRKSHDLREPEKLRSWLCQIVRNAALGHLRRKRGHDNLDEALSLADESPAPDEVLAGEEEAALIRDSLSKLPEIYRLPLVLFYRDGQSVRAVAETLAISEDAVRQRLARGREMLRERVSGLIESVLTRTGPTTVFTITIAAAIGALVAPAAIAGTVFTATSAAASTSSSALSSQVLTVMSTTKTCLITAALLAAACIPVGYHVAANKQPVTQSASALPPENQGGATAPKAPPSFESSAIFAEWRRLHDTYGTTAEAMPAIYDAIASLKDTFRRRAFRTALIAEWVQVDGAGGFSFMLGQRDTSQRDQFFAEWLSYDASAAVTGLLASGTGWQQIARNSLIEIARKAPSRIPEIVEQLPEFGNSSEVLQAYAIFAEKDLNSARAAAEAMTGPTRGQALGGVAQAWAKTRIEDAIAWAKALPAGTDRDEIIRAALFGKASVDPVGALDQVGIVPPRGDQGHFASTTGARMLRVAANADYDATVAWIAAHPGRLGREDMMGIADAVADRLNADPIAFLNRHMADNTLVSLIPAINSAVLNDASGQRVAMWDWLKAQPDTETTKLLKRDVLHAACSQDPFSAMDFVKDLPDTSEGEQQIQLVASSMWNGGNMLHRFDKLLEQAPARLRQPLIEQAFDQLRQNTLTDPQVWIARLALLPEDARARSSVTVVRTWAAQSPEEAIAWVTSLAAGETRSSAMSAAVSIWVAKDFRGAEEWVSTLSAGPEREHSKQILISEIAKNNPREALDRIMSIGDAGERDRVAYEAVQVMARRDRATARQWIEAVPFSPEVKTLVLSLFERIHTAPESQAASPR